MRPNGGVNLQAVMPLNPAQPSPQYLGKARATSATA
jgi:hypothetical protein